MISSLASQQKTNLSLVYGLRFLAVLFTQLYPLALGVAINGALNDRFIDVLWLLACHLSMTVFEYISKRADTRVFNQIYTDLVSDMVNKSQAMGTDTARIAARTTMSKDYITFLERDVPSIIIGLLGLTISVSVLLWMAPVVGLTCLCLFLPVTLLNMRLAKRSERFTKRLNDRLENEVKIIQGGNKSAIQRHLKLVAAWRVKLSDDEANTFTFSELFVIALFIIALWQVSTLSFLEAGTVYTIFAYIWRFVTSLDDLPQIVQQYQKLKDLTARLKRS